jgi:hypothetical protein
MVRSTTTNTHKIKEAIALFAKKMGGCKLNDPVLHKRLFIEGKLETKKKPIWLASKNALKTNSRTGLDRSCQD